MTQPRALILFGSDSDKPVYEAITHGLAHATARVCSAHRTPEELERLLEREQYDVVIAGAGLAAHLPGVVASQTIKPVIGVPVDSAFGGLDALLAIIQMPPGVPVLCVGVDGAEQAARFVRTVRQAQGVAFVNHAAESGEKAMERCAAQLAAFGITAAENPREDTVTIAFHSLAAAPPGEQPPMTINVPVKESTQAEDAQRLLALTQHGVWVGVNRADNAAIAAVQLLNLGGAYTARLEQHRQQMRYKIHRANKQERATYASAGVSIEAGNEAVRRMRADVRSTFTPQVLADFGLFGGLFSLAGLAEREPVLVASTDGVGTKVKLAATLRRYDTVGQDLVNHCTNDILAQGARPLFFLDYVAASVVDPEVVAATVRGLALACKANGCALVGGETAEMPGVYRAGHYDLAGTIVGVVDRERIVTGEQIRAGDALIGLASSGLHTNGYSLALRVLIDQAGLRLDGEHPRLGTTLGDALLAVHRSYLRQVWPLLELGLVRGIAHITGGGLIENLPRILPAGLAARIDTTSWEIPSLFALIQETGNVERREMWRTFNMGIGMVLVVSAAQREQVLQLLQEGGEAAVSMGSIVEGKGVII